VGIDVNDAAIGEATADAETRELRDVQFIVGDVLLEPNVIEPHAFDAVVLIRVLTCFPDGRERVRLLTIAS